MNSSAGTGGQPRADRAPGQAHRGGTMLLQHGRVCTPRRLLSGWAMAQRMLLDGRRQILELFVPGDVLGLAGPSQCAPSDIFALTAVLTAPISADEDLSGDRERELERYCTQIIRLGSLSAYERTADLILALARRTDPNALERRQSIPFPVGQEVLADALGLSYVHLNRMLQQLRRQRLISLHSGMLIVLDAEALERLSR